MKSYVCVLSTDSYLYGLLVLNENLKDLNSKYSLLCLINETISKETINVLKKYEIKYKLISSIKGIGEDKYNPQWSNSFDKLNIFNLIEYEKIVYLDLDLLILTNIDELFNHKHISMVSDRPFSDNFNSGVMVITPNNKDYINMKNMFDKNPKKYKGDQDIINEYFSSNINKISKKYNSLRAVFYEEIYKYDKRTKQKNKVHKVCIFNCVSNPKIIHYIGVLKPFMTIDRFNDIYCEKYFNYKNNIMEK